MANYELTRLDSKTITKIQPPKDGRLPVVENVMFSSPE